MLTFSLIKISYNYALIIINPLMRKRKYLAFRSIKHKLYRKNMPVFTCIDI